MTILIIDNHTKHLQELSSCFPVIPDIFTKEEFDSKTNIGNYDLIVLSGGSNVPTVMRHPEHYAKELELIRSSKAPILGICLGAELIIKAFDGQLKELVETDSKHIMFNGNRIDIYEHHTIGADELPKELSVCSKSEKCIEIFKHSTRPIIGIQFHPEIGHHTEIFDWIFKELDRK